VCQVCIFKALGSSPLSRPCIKVPDKLSVFRKNEIRVDDGRAQGRPGAPLGCAGEALNKSLPQGVGGGGGGGRRIGV